MPDPKPNILFITTDQQRYDASGGAGPSFLRTPHYDHLRREGITFTRAYADCPLCVPARVSMITGKHAVTHGVLGNTSTSEKLRRDGTLPTLLREQGYATAAIGKMHFGPERVRHGFDEMIIPSDYYRYMAKSGHDCQPMHHGLGQNELYPTMATVPEAQTLTSWTAEQCVEYIRERRDPTVPFFLWCSFSKPHPPLDPPEPYYSMYRNCPIPEPFHGAWRDGKDCPAALARMAEQHSFDLIPPEIIREARAAYYGLITQIDYNMGRVFAALQDLDMFSDTLIIYTSDHGEFLGDHRMGSKVFFHESSAHVPFVIRPPQSWECAMRGHESTDLTSHADIMPTVLAAIDADLPGDMDGMDLLSMVRGDTKARPYMHASSLPSHAREYAAVSNGRFKYSYYPEGAAELLFDIETDPKEETNLAKDKKHEAIRNELRAELIRWHGEKQTELVTDGTLLERPLQEDTTEERRTQNWPGYHTENYEKDVRH